MKLPRVSLVFEDPTLLELLKLLLPSVLHMPAELTARTMGPDAEAESRDCDVLVVELPANGSLPACERLLNRAHRRIDRPYVIGAAHRSAVREDIACWFDDYLDMSSILPGRDFVEQLPGAIDRGLDRVRRSRDFSDWPEPIFREFSESWLAGSEGAPPAIAAERERFQKVLPQAMLDFIEGAGARKCLFVPVGPWSPILWEYLAVAPPADSGRAIVFPRLAPRKGERRELAQTLRLAHAIIGDPDDEDDTTGVGGVRTRAVLTRFTESIRGGELIPVLMEETIGAVEKVCSAPLDLLHVTCHARVREGRGEIKIIVDHFGDQSYVSAGEFARAFRDAPPRVVVLETCYGGFGPEGLAATMIRAGVEAVVCFSTRPDQGRAADVMAAFYRGLQEEDFCLDAAAWRANRAVVSGGEPVAPVVIVTGDRRGLDALRHFRRSYRGTAPARRESAGARVELIR